MKIRLMIAVSVALNIALVASIFLSTKKIAPPLGADLAVPSVVETTSSPAPPELSALPGQPFQWDMIVADDLKLYRDNLRDIGCPEMTVEEIIRAVINENFGERRRRILEPAEAGYWDMVLGDKLRRRQRLPQTDWGRALTALANERQQLISDVLGRDALDSEVVRLTRRSELEQQRAWLPAEKREQLADLEARHEQQLADWSAGLNTHPNSPPTPQDEDRLKHIQADFDTAEAQLLTPAERAELKLRESDVAGWAASLPGFNPTEDEWRPLTQLRAQFEEAQNALTDPGLTDDERAARQNELQAGFDDAVKAALPADRLAQFQLANDSEYQSLHAVAQRYGLPDTVVGQSLDIQQTAQNMANQVRTSSNISSEDQQSTLNAIQAETERTLSQLLGPGVFSTYQEYGGDWIEGLKPAN